MNRRSFLASAAAPLFGQAPAVQSRGSARRPNIVLLFTDEQRFDTLGAMGNRHIRTPNLDRLAASGVCFTNAFTPSPICIAARMSLISGHRCRLTRIAGNSRLAGGPARLPTIMDALDEAGYRTHAVGKMHFDGRHYGLHRHERMEETPRHRIDDDYLMYLRRNGVRTRHPQGLRDLLYLQPQTSGIPLEHSENNWIADRSIAFLNEHLRHRGSQPFFLWASWIAPHPPFAPCEPYDKAYDPQALPLAYYRERPLASLPSPAWKERARMDGAQEDEGRLRRIKALYYGQISHIDAAAGRILAELDRTGLAENTVVLFTSDHGEMLGDHGLGHKSVPYEPSVHVPLLLRWPGRTEAGRVRGDLVGLTDIFPTILDGLGLKYPSGAPKPAGMSLISAPGGGCAQPRESFVAEFGVGPSRWVSVRTRTHKYAFWAAGGREELFDLAADAEERNNVAPSPLAGQLRERALDWERREGLTESFEGGRIRTYEEPPVPKQTPRSVVINEGRWPEALPVDERDSIESYAEAFSRAILRETTLSPDKLSLRLYKQGGGHSLEGTPWKEAWRRA